jgi:7-cyano-7-deazaguanine synthase
MSEPRFSYRVDRVLPKGRAVVLLSGGLDSATALAIARARGDECHTVAFDYGQRHRAELVAARRVSQVLGAESHRELKLPIGELGGSALTDRSIAVPEHGGAGIPVTYVPARNTVFLSLALAVAEVLGADKIVIGVNAIDYSGYPDCRPEYIEAFQHLARLATKRGVEGGALVIDAPLVTYSKADIVRRGRELGVDYSLTVSCYQADDEGRACGRCDSCRLRREGFAAAGVPDPTRYRDAR